TVSLKANINTLVSLIKINVGGAIADVAIMFLAIPIIAILKVIFDRIDELSPWCYLMRDDIPKTFTWHRIRLPLYNTDSVNETVSVTAPEKPAIQFTEITTDPED